MNIKRGLAALAALVVCTSWAQPPNPIQTARERPPIVSEAQQGARSGSKQNEKPAPSARLSATHINNTQPPSCAAPGNKTAEYNKCYLDTQERIASSAEIQKWASIVAVIVALAGTAIAFCAFKFLKKTYKQTRHAAISAARTARIAHREFIATHRPRIIIRSFQVMNPEFSIKRGELPHVIFVATNIGES